MAELVLRSSAIVVSVVREEMEPFEMDGKKIPGYDRYAWWVLLDESTAPIELRVDSTEREWFRTVAGCTRNDIADIEVGAKPAKGAYGKAVFAYRLREIHGVVSATTGEVQTAAPVQPEEVPA